MKTARETLDALVLGVGIPPKARILVAVSGGPDSTALLSSLLRLSGAPSRRWTLRVGHVNHTLRGSEATDDELFVRDLAKQNNLRVEVAVVDTRRLAREQGISEELAARELRRTALDDMLVTWPGDLIALGHTQNDQAETVLQRMLRGTGLDGLAGMTVRGGGRVRPLLAIPRELVLAALAEDDQPYRLDWSNENMRYQRNRIRHEAIPFLSRFQPRVVATLSRTAQLLGDDADYIRREAALALIYCDVSREGNAVSVGMGPWRSLHPSLRHNTLRLLVHQLLGTLADMEEGHIAAIIQTLGRPAGRFALYDQLPHELNLDGDERRFTLRRGARIPSPHVTPTPLTIPGDTETTAGSISVRLQTVDNQSCMAHLVATCGPLHALLDADLVTSTLHVRSRQPGDRIRSVGAPGTRKLQDIMVDRRIPVSLRDSVPVVERQGQPVWVPGLALDERVAATAASRHVLHLVFRPRQWESVIEFLSQSGL